MSVTLNQFVSNLYISTELQYRVRKDLAKAWWIVNEWEEIDEYQELTQEEEEELLEVEGWRLEYCNLIIQSDYTFASMSDAWLKLQKRIRISILHEWGYKCSAKILSNYTYDPFGNPFSKGINNLFKEEGSESYFKWVIFLQSIGWTIDWLRKIPKDCIGAGFTIKHHEYEECEYIQTLSPQRVINLLKEKKKTVNHGEIIEISTYPLMGDTGRNWKYLMENHPEVLLTQPRLRDLFEVHDWMYKQKVHLEPSYELPVNAEIQSLIGSSFEGFDVVFPTETRQLKEWGYKLSHCVGGYGQRILHGESIVFSLEQEGEPVYTVEISKSWDESYYCNQFYGYKNSAAPPELVEKLNSLL